MTSLGKTVSQREVLDLPLNGRNVTQLGLLQPVLCLSLQVWPKLADRYARDKPTR